MLKQQRRLEVGLASVARGAFWCVGMWSFDQDGNSFSMPLNTICVGITEDLMPGELDYGRDRPTRNPVFWD